MKKSAPYFKHDAHAAGSPKLMRLLDMEKTRGYGLYWLLMERLRLQPGFRLPVKSVGGLAVRFGTTPQVLSRIIHDYELFVVEDGHFHSPGMMKRMDAFIRYIEGTSPVSLPPQETVNVLDISNETVPNARLPDHTLPKPKSSPSLAGAARILSMDQAIGLLPCEQFWCEDIARRFGRGLAFGQELPGLLTDFTCYLRLRGEEHTVHTLSDAKRRFLYWLMSTEGKLALKRLDAANRSTLNPYETIIDGRRTYMGHPIPDDAPPRPDAFAAWDDALLKWTR